jgi:hypothetical protein
MYDLYADGQFVFRFHDTLYLQFYVTECRRDLPHIDYRVYNRRGEEIRGY